MTHSEPEIDRLALLEERITLLQAALENALSAQGVQNSMASEARLDADEYISCAHGFYELEYNDSGVPYRWTGPGKTFQFWLNLERSTDKNIAIVVGAPFIHEAMADVIVTANGQTLETEFTSSDTGSILNCRLPALPFPNVLPILLKVHLKKTISPQEAGLSDDIRRLGVQFFALEVTNA